MTPEVFFTYIQDGHIGIWWGGALTRRSAVGLPLYQLLVVTILCQSIGNSSFFLSNGSRNRGKILSPIV